MSRLPIPILLCVLMLWLPVPVFAASGASFERTGLLAGPGERAEDIVIRAHTGDMQAVMLAIVGYSMGAGGFPKDMGLALAWLDELSFLGAAEPMAVASLAAFSQDEVPEQFLGAALAACPGARGSALGQALGKGDVFDVERFCDALEERKKTTPQWRAQYREAVDEQERMIAAIPVAMRAVRDFRDGPVTGKTRAAFTKALEQLSVGAVIFYGAATHDPAEGQPDWSGERLAALLASIAETKAGASTGTAVELAELADGVSNAITAVLHGNTPETARAIRLAHDMTPVRSLEAGGKDGEALASVRVVAENYRYGRGGFVKSDLLARSWRHYASLQGDGLSMAQMAAESLAARKFVQAWACAFVAGNGDVIRTSDKSRQFAARLLKMIEARAGTEVKAAGMDAALKWLDARTKRMDCYERQLDKAAAGGK